MLKASEIAGMRMFLKIEKSTRWRRGRDSNPRYGFPYSSFQDWRLQPLGHLSGYYSSTTVPSFFAGIAGHFPSLSIDYTQPVFQCIGFQDHPFSTTYHPSVRTAANAALASVYNSQRCRYRETLATPFYFERPKAREWNCMISLKCARK